MDSFKKCNLQARRVCTALTLRLGILIKHFSIEKSLSLFRLRLFSRAIIGNVDRYILGSLEFRNQRRICRCGKMSSRNSVINL